MAAQFLLVQLGFGVPRATEAAAHAARAFISGLQPGEGFLKLDFKNAFNIVRRDEMLRLVRDELPCPVTMTRHGHRTRHRIRTPDHSARSD